jgi:plasmid maintenance system antidote protein VapI
MACQRHPYCAKNSKNYSYLTNQIQNGIKKMIPNDNKAILFDISYEGESLETYLNLTKKYDLIEVKNVGKRTEDFRKESFKPARNFEVIRQNN